MSHTLIQRGKKDWTCTVCHQDWQTPSKAHCPGMHVVSAEEWGILMTKTQLGKAGYKNDAKHLPKSTVCYRRSYDGSDPEYVKLYDPTLCERKPTRRTGRRRSGWLHDIVIPSVCLPFVERCQVACNRDGVESVSTHDFDYEDEALMDLANVILMAQWMTDKELSQMGFVTIQIAAFNCRKGQTFDRDRNRARSFANRVLAGWQAYCKANDLPFVEIVRRITPAPPQLTGTQRRLPGLE